MSVIKADINTLNSMISFINDKAEQCKQLCDQINTIYEQIPWEGVDRNWVDQTADRMKVASMKAAFDDFKGYAELMQDWIRMIELYQGMMRGILDRLE